MKWWTGVALLVLIFSGCTSYDIERSSRNSTHYIEPNNGGRCSSTAIGPHALLTAEHCDDANADTMKIDGVEVHIDGRVKDGEDHIIYLYDHVKFDHWSEVVPFDFNVPLNVYMWGDASGYTGLFRRGTISNIFNYQGEVLVLIDLNVYYGDSGSALFNEYGQIILVFNDLLQDGHISHGQFVALKLAACKPLAFSQDELMKASSYGTTGTNSHQTKR